jgi:hypothetical protein
MERKTKSGWKPWKPPPEKQDRRDRWGLRGKTAWDWLDLMIVPVMLALFAGFFTTVQLFWQTAAEQARDQSLANQTAELQRFIEEFRVQRDALQGYLDLMADLLLNHDLLDAEPDSDVVAIAQAQTLTILRQLDSQGKRTVVLFLLDARLIQATAETGPVIALAEADLSNADLSGASLEGADLSDADLGNADLGNADLSGANLDGVDLTSANLKDANLSGAEGITNEKLEQEADDLDRATMPNGQKYEDWLKSKGRKQNGKNDGSS